MMICFKRMISSHQGSQPVAAKMQQLPGVPRFAVEGRSRCLRSIRSICHIEKRRPPAITRSAASMTAAPLSMVAMRISSVGVGPDIGVTSFGSIEPCEAECQACPGQSTKETWRTNLFPHAAYHASGRHISNPGARPVVTFQNISFTAATGGVWVLILPQ